MNIAEIRKALVAILGVVAMIVSSGLVHGTALAILNGALGLATALGVYGVPNGQSLPADVKAALAANDTGAGNA